jgi:hypothetical protein
MNGDERQDRQQAEDAADDSQTAETVVMHRPLRGSS